MKPIYMYGMILSTRSFLLCDSYPPADGYAEVKSYQFHVGGETAVASLILSSLGCKVVMAGANTGTENDSIIRTYFREKNVDLQYLKYNESFGGVIDNVIIDKQTRTCFGSFGHLFGSREKWFEPPDEAAIQQCDVVGTDPFFGEEIVDLCIRHHKPYATIDCAYDSRMLRHCAIAAISHQHLRSCYPELDVETLYQRYTENTEGLVIFTMGEKAVIYGRKGQPAQFFTPFAVDVVSTLGAGDSFKAGTVYALHAGFNDRDTVAFACAVAGVAISQFPIAQNPPTLQQVQTLLATRKQGESDAAQQKT